MLVLNTNESSGVKFGYGEGGYPDINQILLKPICGKYPGKSTYDASSLCEKADNSRIAFKRNGTIVNYNCQKLIYPNMILGNSKGNGYGTFGGLVSTSNTTVSIGIDPGLKGGEIIGKKMEWMARICTNGKSSPDNTIFYAEIKLLHKDGTLTNIGSLGEQKPVAPDFSTNSEMYYDSYTYNHTMYKKLYKETNGVVALEGDCVLASILIEGNKPIVFGNDGSSVNVTCIKESYVASNTIMGMVPLPIQISID